MKRVMIGRQRLKSTFGSAVIAIGFALVLFVSGVPRDRASVAEAHTVTAAGELLELAIEDGVPDCTIGPATTVKGKPGFGWVNKLTPPSYPATIRTITVGFERGFVFTGVKPDSLYRVVVYLDPEGDGPGNNQPPDSTFIGRVRGTDQTMTFNLITPLTIQGGSFVVGVIDDFGIADMPALMDSPGMSHPPGSDSFFTQTGGAIWQKLSDSLTAVPHCSPGSWMIRATVELGAVDPLAVTRIKDPAAVEPWGMGSLGTEVVVTNLVSDNLTIINTTNNSFRSLEIVDPRVCLTCGPPFGPFGVASVPARNKVYVTLSGSTTVPSKEFPTDYQSVLPGRVVVLSKVSGVLTQSGFIDVGTGPKFPAAAAGKLYVPCGGANRVDVINTATDLKIAEIPVGADPSSCAASLDESRIYVTNFGDGTVSVIDTRTDKKVKDIPAPFILFPQSIGQNPLVPTRPAIAQNPWTASVSPTNGNLYVAYWSTTAGDVTPNGAIVEFDTCKEEFVRAIIDDTFRGSAPGSAGASGIPAPAAPLTRDPATGKTLEAGGGGGGPFSISPSVPNALDVQPTTMLFTNDGLGIAGVLDARIDQLVSAPPIAVASCPKPRGITCVTVNVASPIAGTPPRPTHFAYVASGQPDSSVLVFRVPELRENIGNIPVIESADIGDVLRVAGTGFAKFDMRFDVMSAGTCLSFIKPAVSKQKATIVVQKGKLSDGSRITDSQHQNAIIRLVHPDGTTRVLRR